MNASERTEDPTDYSLPRAQRYSSPQAQQRMAEGNCPECGRPAAEHSGEVRFWVRFDDCSLLPHGVVERIEQYERDQAHPNG